MPKRVIGAILAKLPWPAYFEHIDKAHGLHDIGSRQRVALQFWRAGEQAAALRDLEPLLTQRDPRPTETMLAQIVAGILDRQLWHDPDGLLTREEYMDAFRALRVADPMLAREIAESQRGAGSRKLPAEIQEVLRHDSD